MKIFCARELKKKASIRREKTLDRNKVKVVLVERVWSSFYIYKKKKMKNIIRNAWIVPWEFFSDIYVPDTNIISKFAIKSMKPIDPAFKKLKKKALSWRTFRLRYSVTISD